jgi:hypothetical protein
LYCVEVVEVVAAVGAIIQYHLLKSFLIRECLLPCPPIPTMGSCCIKKSAGLVEERPASMFRLCWRRSAYLMLLDKADKSLYNDYLQHLINITKLRQSVKVKV